MFLFLFQDTLGSWWSPDVGIETVSPGWLVLRLGFHCVAHAGLKLSIFLSPPLPRCWDYRFAHPGLSGFNLWTYAGARGEAWDIWASPQSPDIPRQLSLSKSRWWPRFDRLTSGSSRLEVRSESDRRKALVEVGLSCRALSAMSADRQEACLHGAGPCSGNEEVNLVYRTDIPSPEILC